MLRLCFVLHEISGFGGLVGVGFRIAAGWLGGGSWGAWLCSVSGSASGGGQTVWADRVNHVTHYPASDDVADNALVDKVCGQYARMTGTTFAAAR